MVRIAPPCATELETYTRRRQSSSANHSLVACREQVGLVQDVAIRVVRAFDDVRVQILRYQNTLCTVNNLPTEILSYIFQLVAGIGTVCPTNLRVASVCSHWRAVSLHDPITWSHFDATSTSNYMELAMPRAQSVPLSIVKSPDLNTPTRLVQLTWDHVGRMRVLELRGSSKDSLEIFSGALLPLLNELAFSHGDGPDNALPCISGFPITPSLHHLSLYGCMLNVSTIDQSSKEFGRLNTLEIEISEKWALDGLFESLLALCRAAPGLKYLLVSSPLTQLVPSNLGFQRPPAHGPVRMEHLRYFNLNVPPSLLMHLLNSLAPQNPARFAVSTALPTSVRDFCEQLWTRTRLPVAIFSDLQELEIRFECSCSLSIDGSKHIGLLNPDVCQNVYVFYGLPPESSGRVPNYMAPVVSFILDTPMPKLKHLEVVQLRGSLPADEINKRDIRKLTASIHQLLVGFPGLTSISLRFTLKDSFIGLRFRFPDISNSGTPVFPSLRKCTLQVAQGIRSSTIYTLVRQLCPVDIAELRFEDVVFEVRTLQEADEFARDDLSKLGRVVWVKGCSISVIGGGGRRSLASFWQEGEECPLRINLEPVLEP